ncbi:MAG: zf-HC2 domain-containing protein [Acidobacteria bacterium]|nr:zf-HC2 domain-containing protein [Acidobacteriota bacterium]
MTSLGWEDDGAQEGLMLRRSVGKCLTEAEMEDYLANRLSGVTREVIEEHLLVCSKCLDSVEQEEEFAALFRSAAMQMEAEEMEKSFLGETSATSETEGETQSEFGPCAEPATEPKGWWARLLHRLRGR